MNNMNTTFLIILVSSMSILLLYGTKKFILKKNIWKKQAGSQEIKKLRKYDDFKEFIYDLPKYSINNSLTSSLLREIMKKFGIRFQQVIFFDQGVGSVRTAWIKYTGDIMYHEQGAYFPPFRLGTSVIPYDCHDSRPLLELSDEVDWRNPEMCADIVRAKINAEQRKALQGSAISGVVIIIAIIAVIAVVIGIGYYLDTRMTANTKLLFDQINQTLQNHQVIRIQ